MKAWLFDLDGTLVDTAPDLAAAANQLRERRGLGPLPLAHYRPWASAGARGLIHAALGLAPEHPDFAALRADFLAHYRAHLADQAALFPGLDAVLRQFEAEGRPWGVVTNKPAWLTLPLMAALGLDRRAVSALTRPPRPSRRRMPCSSPASGAVSLPPTAATLATTVATSSPDAPRA
jgi:N-acetyl-D-muramate 6-phosphate phosphatase